MSLPQLVEALRGQLIDDERVDAAYVFGSAVHGTLRDDSDVDLAIRWADAQARAAAHADMLTLLGRLGRSAGRDVHVVDLERIGPELRRRVFGEGTAVLDRSPRRTRDDHVRALMEVMDWEYARSLRNAALDAQLAETTGHG